VPELPPDLPKHPVGTFAFVGTYAVVFVLLWYAIYVFIFLAVACAWHTLHPAWGLASPKCHRLRRENLKK